MERLTFLAARACALLLLAWTGGCSDKKDTAKAAPSLAEPPSAEETLEIVPAWAARTNNVATLQPRDDEGREDHSRV